MAEPALETGDGLSSRALAESIAAIASSKLASDLVILDMRDLVSYTDYLVICSARNERQAEAITEQVRQVMKDEKGVLPVNPARTGEVGWAVLDYMDCVLHVFTGETRDLYDLEELWFEAPKSRPEEGVRDSGGQDEEGGEAGSGGEPGADERPDTR